MVHTIYKSIANLSEKKNAHHFGTSMELVDLTTVDHIHWRLMNFDLNSEPHTHQTSVPLCSHSSADKDLMSSSLALLGYVHSVAGPSWGFHLVSCSYHRLSLVLVHRSHGCLLESCGIHLDDSEGNHYLLMNV